MSIYIIQLLWKSKNPRTFVRGFLTIGYEKIFSAVLRMNLNSCKNEILADARVKSANADEIFGFASDEIKSTHSPSRRISPNEVGFHRSRRFHPPARVDLVEKSTDKVDAFFWRRRRDLLSPAGSVRVGSDSPPGCHSLPTRSNPLTQKTKNTP